jgi:hypothetical protein
MADGFSFLDGGGFDSGGNYYAPSTSTGLQAPTLLAGSPQLTPNTPEMAAYSAPTTTAIPVSNLTTPQTPINLSSTLTPTVDQSSTAVAGATQTSKSLEDYIKMLTPPTSESQTQYDTLSKSLNDLLGQSVNKSADQLSAEQASGIPELKTQLSGLNADILRGTAEYDQLKKEYEALSVDNRGKAITMGSIRGNEAQINYARQSALNTKASEVGLLQARALGVQGNLQAAQQNVDRAIDLKYQTIEQSIKVRLQQIDLIKDQLDTEQTRRAQALELYLRDQQQQIDETKASEKQLQNIAITAASAGAPQTLINQALATKDPVQASSLLNQYLRATGETSGTTSNGYFIKPTAAQLDGAQFYKYPSSSQVYTSNGTTIDLATYKQLTNQTNVPDDQVNFSGIKTIDQSSSSPSLSPSPTTKYTVQSAYDEILSTWTENQYIQGNGKISSTDYKQAKSLWIQKGFTASKFDELFAPLIDTSGDSWKADYGYKGN